MIGRNVETNKMFPLERLIKLPVVTVTLLLTGILLFVVNDIHIKHGGRLSVSTKDIQTSGPPNQIQMKRSKADDNGGDLKNTLPSVVQTEKMLNSDSLKTTTPQSMGQENGFKTMEKVRNLDLQVKNGTVLILTLLHNSEKYLVNFTRLLKTFSYPKHLISLAFGEDNSQDKTVEKAQQMVNELRKDYADAKFFSFKELNSNGTGLGVHKHAGEHQLVRRQHIAFARNSLLSSVSLYDVDYVMWLDVDVIETPPDVIQRLIAAKKDIVVPNCWVKWDHGRQMGTYDLNSWKETEESLRFQKEQKPTYVFFEGYGQTRPQRRYMDSLRYQGDVVEIDGVGGCLILLKAEHHRKGLIFPTFNYRNQIETEGLGCMAQDMGLKVFGMPNLVIIHICDADTGIKNC